MTGGRALILGETGRNFAAGMSGGIAWVYNPNNTFAGNCNTEMADLDTLTLHDEQEITSLLQEHVRLTGSTLAQHILDNWKAAAAEFVKVYPKEYKKVLEKMQYQTIS